MTGDRWVVLAASSLLFLLGLIDDFRHIKPYQKLIGQMLAASVVIYAGLVLPWTGSFAVNMLVTFVWLIGVTNAVNMLDNMDGLSAGVAAIASLFLAGNFLLNGQLVEAAMLAVFSAALVGFLVYNHNPASIFMGDCGSMFVGFFLASSALLSAQAGGGRSRSVVAVLAVPVLVLFIPIFDTTFVTLVRKLSGRAASQGGRDHTSHRLVALGLSERQAVWMLWAFAVVGGLLSFAVRRWEIDVSVAVIATFALALSILGVYLAGVRVYDPDEVERAQKKPLMSFLVDLSYKRRVFEVALDAVLIALAYYAGYALVFGPVRGGSPDWTLFFLTVPAVIGIKLASFLAMGVYRGLWKYAGVSDVVVYAKGVALGSAATIFAVLFAFRFEGFSRTVYALDAIVLLILVTSTRFAFRVLRRLMPAQHPMASRRVLIFGAGDGGELTYRELMNNPDLESVPIGFLDDDPRKKGKVLHGLPIFSGDQPLAEIQAATGADELLISTNRISPARFRSIVAACEQLALPVRRMRLELQRVADREMGWVLPDEGASPASQEVSPRLPLLDPASRGTSVEH
jgi:UDP-GlcNAc:undecaprenyl-phosphate/decaprenyl-phosphate GlcNAc-1-phosphate transferase